MRKTSIQNKRASWCGTTWTVPKKLQVSMAFETCTFCTTHARSRRSNQLSQLAQYIQLWSICDVCQLWCPYGNPSIIQISINLWLLLNLPHISRPQKNQCYFSIPQLKFQEGGHDSKKRLDSYNNGVQLEVQEVLRLFLFA